MAIFQEPIDTYCFITHLRKFITPPKAVPKGTEVWIPSFESENLVLNITQKCGPSEYNNGMLGAHFEYESPCATFWPSDRSITKAHKTIVEQLSNVLWARERLQYL